MPCFGSISLILFFFFFLVFKCDSYEVLLILDKEKHMGDGSLYYYFFNTLLFCLLIYHIYWWLLMMRMLVKQIHARGHLSDDVRSGNLLIHIYKFKQIIH